MPDMNDISAIFSLLSGTSGDSGGEEQTEQNEQAESGGGIDPEMLIKLMEVFAKLNETDRNTELIMALKPHLRQENRAKADMAAQLMKLMTVLNTFGGNIFF